MTAVIEILQSISDYRPDEKDYDHIWDEVQSQTNYFGLVALDGKVDVVGYGSIFIERKIRGGKMGHIEDIVIDEKEALLTEANMIKEHRPKYNVLLKYDKTFPFAANDHSFGTRATLRHSL